MLIFLFFLSFRVHQILSQFLCDVLLNYIDNCRLFLFQMGDIHEKLSFPIGIYQLTLMSCQLLGIDLKFFSFFSAIILIFIKDGIKFETIFKFLTRKQNEFIFSKLTDLLLVYK